jgi:hypothetical protein
LKAWDKKDPCSIQLGSGQRVDLDTLSIVAAE